MKLYYVRTDDESGENADAYVWAENPDEAQKLTADYWKTLSGWDSYEFMWVDEVPTEKPFVSAVVPWENVVRHEKVPH